MTAQRGVNGEERTNESIRITNLKHTIIKFVIKVKHNSALLAKVYNIYKKIISKIEGFPTLMELFSTKLIYI
jgi:hypothetical protein